MHKNYAIAQFLATFACCKKKHVMEAFQWLKDLFTTTDSVAHIALLYAVVIATGVYLGKIKIGGISLGVTFVLFACGWPHWIYCPTSHLDIYSRLRSYTVCLHDRTTGWTWFL